jgi:hypothetical protein
MLRRELGGRNWPGQPPVYRMHANIRRMWHLLTMFRVRADLLALEGTVARAGCALACPFSSSDEFEAAVVKSKLAAGIYGPKRRRRHMLYVVAASSALAVLAWML